MIIDTTDPTGLGLFSRCARNQACKTTKTRPKTASSKLSKHSTLVLENRRQKSATGDYFSKQESRDQRQIKFKRQPTPAVGQYNNVIIKPKPKLVWDVIKLFHKETKHVRELEQLKEKINQKNERNYKSLDYVNEENHNLEDHQHSTGNDNNNELKHLHNNYANATITQPLQQHKKFPKNNSSKHKLVQSFSHKNREVVNLSNDDSSMQYQSNTKGNHNSKVTQTGILKKSIIKSNICMVDMSRTTGRQRFDNSNNTKCSEDPTSENIRTVINTKSDAQFYQINRQMPQIQLHKTIEQIKPRTKQNYYFKKMLGRKDEQSKMPSGNTYDCNIDLVRPKKSALLDFAIVKGREDGSIKKAQQITEYSYIHYDYDEYVWKGQSSVFPNTKKNLIPFQMQI